MSIFALELAIVILLSTSAFAATDFYIFPNDSNQKLDCEFLEIKNNQVLCTAKNLLITFDIDQIKLIEVVHGGKSQNFDIFSQETLAKINKLSSDKLDVKKISKQEENKNKTLNFILRTAQSLINDFKNLSGKTLTSNILTISGVIVLLIGSVSFLIATFRAGILWGFCCMFLPFVSFVFLFVHWKNAAKPFFISRLGAAMLFLSTMFTQTTVTARSVSKFNSDANRANTNSNNAAFQCSGKIYCSEMSSCAEAKFYLRNCPGTKMDGDNDGIPCENQWCGN